MRALTSLSRTLGADRLSEAGLLIVVGICFIATVGPFLVTYDPISQNLADRLQAPGLEHPFGTDDLGRDILSRVVYGAAITPVVSAIIIVITTLIGIAIGLISGYYGGRVDDVIMRVTDMFLAFPSLVLAMAIAGVLGPSLTNAMLALIVTWWPEYARLVRGSTLSEREKEYVQAARAVGESNMRILFRHIAPNIVTPIVVKATGDIGLAILLTSSLSFIGVGAAPPSPEWGAMVAIGRHYITSAWWVVTFPGLAITIAVMGFNFLGEGLRATRL